MAVDQDDVGEVIRHSRPSWSRELTPHCDNCGSILRLALRRQGWAGLLEVGEVGVQAWQQTTLETGLCHRAD